MHILLIGAGKMGGALLTSWSKESRYKLTILDPYPTPAILQACETGAKHITSAKDIPSDISICILAIKPQMFQSLAGDISIKLASKTLVISILAGTSLDAISEYFSKNPIIRAMPNTPASIGKGITAITGNSFAQEKHLSDATDLLAPCGPVRIVNSETLIDAVTAISGSGPAYVFHLVEALTEAGSDLGLDSEDANIFARQMVIGAGALLEQSEESATQLRENVTSPNGTTQAALEVLMSNKGLKPLIKDAAKAAFKRAQELSK